jgi:hypothetical protein
MKFVDLNKDNIRENSELVGNTYIYTLGSPVEITSIKRRNNNSMISKSLAENVKEDKLMIKYIPTNKILFSKNFIESSPLENFASCKVDSEGNCLYIGSSGEFGNVSKGLLAFSGYLSLNNLVEEDRPILCTKNMISTIVDKIRVLSLGVRGDSLYGLFYIPDVRGLRLSIRGSADLGVSATTLKNVKCKGYTEFTIKDWFDKAKVVGI